MNENNKINHQYKKEIIINPKKKEYNKTKTNILNNCKNKKEKQNILKRSNLKFIKVKYNLKNLNFLTLMIIIIYLIECI